MEIKDIKLSDIKPYKNNPRNNESAVQQVANSIKEFGFKLNGKGKPAPPKKKTTKKKVK